MKLFIKDHLSIVILYGITFFGLFLLYDWLDGFTGGKKAYFIFLSSIILLLFLLYRYFTHWKLYKLLSSPPEKTEDMLIQNPHSILEEAFSRNMSSSLQLHQGELNRLKNRQQEYQTMLNQWVHQIKTPLSVIGMLTEMNEGHADFAKVKASLNKIKYDLAQILTYLRTEDFAADLKIEKTFLREVVTEVINELKDFFIAKSVYPSICIDENLSVYTDKKWLKTMMYQVINNAVKYSENNKKVKIEADSVQDSILLHITNEGEGIEPSDLPRVFDLFFTGEHGRKYGESTGMGLYLVKKIAEMLNHEYLLESIVNETTTFSVYFKS